MSKQDNLSSKLISLRMLQTTNIQDICFIWEESKQFNLNIQSLKPNLFRQLEKHLKLELKVSVFKYKSFKLLWNY